MGRIITSHPQRAPQSIYDDLAWASQRRGEHFRLYGSCVIVVSGGRVLGVGQTRDEALRQAEIQLPPDAGDVDAIVDYIPAPMMAGVLRRVRNLDSN